ncbi:MAG: murein L,D-transpeptidase catalytic domain-containing protein [Flavobacterium sp.]|jgi:hypothetical protein
MKHTLVLLLISLLNCNNEENKTHVIDRNEIKSYSNYHSEALNFIKKESFNEDYYYLVDMSIHSGKNRFFIYDFSSKEITDKNIVTHGSCDKFEVNTTKREKAKFSNLVDSHCSSKGKYKIGKKEYSSWGIKIKYWLHGLEEANKSAKDRVVVLHSWDAVSDEEIYPNYSPLSWGCPAVSNEFMKKLDVQLQNTDKPVLLWIIE